MTDDEGPACGCKVGKVAETYELNGVHDELATRWTDDEERASLRVLARQFNQRVLRRAMQGAGVDVVDGEVENTYHLLVDDDVSSGSRVQIERRLEHAGLEPEDLQDSFVSYQTVYRHLTNCLDAEHETNDDRDPVEKGRDRVRALQNRTVAVTENTLEQLRSNGEIEIGGNDVIVDISAVCSDCGAVVGIDDLFEERACRCRQN